MARIRLTKANLEKLVANLPPEREEYRTDITGCYLRVGPASMSLTVLRRDENKKQVRVSIPINTLNLPNLPALKRLIRQAKESDSHSKISHEPSPDSGIQIFTGWCKLKRSGSGGGSITRAAKNYTVVGNVPVAQLDARHSRTERGVPKRELRFFLGG